MASYKLTYLKRAVALDPNFARAYASLGTAYADLNQFSLAIENYKKAYELRHCSAIAARLTRRKAA
jgi:cytochrome c-type biogenesis protein CcmH/NrfG